MSRAHVCCTAGASVELAHYRASLGDDDAGIGGPRATPPRAALAPQGRCTYIRANSLGIPVREPSFLHD